MISEDIWGEARLGWLESHRSRSAVFVGQPSLLPAHDGARSRCARFSHGYLNRRLIPALCQKAGVPPEDARGRITTHRARSTIATQLFNARRPLTLFELQAWLGHSTPHSTQHYARLSPTKLSRAYTDAQYFQRNLRTIDVLIDQDAVPPRPCGR